ncbi:uncharacterized protein LOC129737643 [Uranotaenia lowii]|uniref:uncharacterized protein LOC129737643 n=1 Tax=Uranotaenia lowii TaxID=190385 RepID=UPI0024795577|nr:uncharacterized protein LOC129737643 [Uranotaenia lowii]
MTSSCGAACNKPDDSHMVQCDVCDLWWHYACVGVGDSIADKDFVCPKCTKSKEAPVPPIEDNISISTVDSCKRRAQLKLQKLEQMKALQERELEQEQRDQERLLEMQKLEKAAEINRKKLALEKIYLDEKFKTLEEEAGDEDDRQSRRSNKSLNSRTLRWKMDRLLGKTTDTTTVFIAPETASTPVSAATTDTRSGVVGYNPSDLVSAIPKLSIEPSTSSTPTTFPAHTGTSHISLPDRQVIVPRGLQTTVEANRNTANTLVLDTISKPLVSTGAIPEITERFPPSLSKFPEVGPMHNSIHNSLPGEGSYSTTQTTVPNSGFAIGASFCSVPQPSSIPLSSYGQLPSRMLPFIVNQQMQAREPTTFSVPVNQFNSVYHNSVSNPAAGAGVSGQPSEQCVNSQRGPYPTPSFPLLPVNPSSPWNVNHHSAYSANPECVNRNETVSTTNLQQQFRGLSSEQIAARQLMGKDLPTFSGNPEDWPLFFGIYNNTSHACGYSDVENLTRLQRSLRGEALDAVRSKLLIPSAVPLIIETLKQMYGRPEIMIFSLLRKVKDTPAPKPDKLETLITFGTVVGNLCDHLEAGQQEAHLNNPTLLFELIAKLPTQMQMDWSMFKDQFVEVNLRTFARFMSVLVKAASDVTLPARVKPDQRGAKAGRSCERNFVHAHSEVRPYSEEAPVPQRDRNSDSRNCKVCKQADHRVRDCEVFKRKDLEERWRIVKELPLCRTCLFQHGRRPCKEKKACGVQGCDYKHHPLLHNPKKNQPNVPASVNSHRNENPKALFRILPVTLHSRGRSIDVYAFLDDGSSITLMENGIAEQLGLEGKSDVLCMSWTADVTREEPNSKWVSLDVSGQGSSRCFPLTNIRTVEKLSLPVQSLEYRRLSSRFPHLAGLPICDYEDAVPRILIGNDNAHLSVSLRKREGEPHSPIATKSRLGWSIHGSWSKLGETLVNYSFHICECSSQLSSLHEIVKQSFAVDNLGIAVCPSPESDEDRRARRILIETTKRVAGRYETGLLWKHDYFEFPDNFAMAVKRLSCLERRMAADSIIGESVRKQIAEYQEKGYLIRATKAEIEAADPRRTWYLPLGVVVNPKKPGKVRIFCDAAAKVDGICLNTMLMKGPDLLVSLPKVLYGFREKRIAVCADIREMFHRVLIRDEDIHAQRILWRSHTEQEPEILLMKVATFGASCSPCSAQYVKNANAREHEERFPRAAESIIHHHYMDDYLQSFDSPEEAAETALQVRFVHSQAGFEIHSWSSNNDEVLRAVGESDPSSVKFFDTTESVSTERILGMFWVRAEDAFTFSSSLGRVPVWPTKREVLRIVMSIYDPLGLLSHFTIHGKILIQDIWRSGKSWDELIPEDIHKRWEKWIALFPQLNETRIPRAYFPSWTSRDLGALQLHAFVDASESAYACAVYLRAEVAGRVECTLISAKAKVTPLKTLTIPRAELMAALIGSRLIDNIVKDHSLEITRRIVWTDSRTVLAWITSDLRRYNQFVSCRIGEIIEKTNPSEWRWIPSKLNVADDATKWGAGPDLAAASRWWSGPKFLYETEENWPAQETKSQEPTEELRVSRKEVVGAHREVGDWIWRIDWANFSRWNRLVHTFAYVYRYVGNLGREARGLNLLIDSLEQQELVAAERLIYRTAQREEYPEEMAILESNRAGKKNLKRSSKLIKLSPFVDEHGVIRMESRISAAAFVSYDARNPIILPPKHRLTELLVQRYHEKYLHRNFGTVVNELRQKYHISQLKSVVRRIAKECAHCRVYNAKPVVPRMSPLPAARLKSFCRPFSYVGLDYFGPMLIRVGRSTVKRWVALFTCLTVRAVHLEVVHSLTTVSCQMAVRRFIGRRGSPIEIYSDNGTNFWGARNELVREIEDINRKLGTIFTNSATQWKFNPPSAPHMGGAWERLVRSVKTAFYAMSTSKNPNEETFGTLMVEAESLVNSRPLTFVSLESEDQEALTPNHFILLSSSGVVQPQTEAVDPRLATRDDYKHTRHLTDIFWHRWIKEYLPVIAQRTKWFEESRSLQPGDLVVIVDESVRNGWLRGRIMKTIEGADGRVRRAVVQTSSGPITRPASKIALLNVVGCKAPEADSPYGRGDVVATSTAHSG